MSTRKILVLAVDAGARQNQKPDEEPGWQASGFALAFNSELRSLSDYDSWWLNILTDSQIRVEHALNLQQCDSVLFVAPQVLETKSPVAAKGSHAADDLESELVTTVAETDSSVTDVSPANSRPEPEPEPEKNTPAYVFQALELPQKHSLESSGGALSPQDLMHTLRTLTSRDTLPDCFQLSVNYHISNDNNDNNDNSNNENSPEHFAATVRFLEQLFIDTDPARWRRMRG